MESAAREGGDRAMLLAALQVGAVNYSLLTPARDPQKAQLLAKEALALAQEMNDQKAAAKVLWIFMLLNMYSGAMLNVIPFGEQSVALAKRLGMREQLAHSLQDLARCYLAVGRLQKAIAVLLEARPWWETLNKLPMLAENHGTVSQIRVMMSDFDEAIDEADVSDIAGNISDDELRQTFRVHARLKIDGHSDVV